MVNSSSSAWERGGPLPSIAVADSLLDERRELTQRISAPDSFKTTSELHVLCRADRI
jgi:hypothetical protein